MKSVLIKEKEEIEKELKDQQLNGTKEKSTNPSTRKVDISFDSSQILPDFMIFFCVYSIKSKKSIIQFENFQNLKKCKESTIKNEFQSLTKLTIQSDFPYNQINPINTHIENYQWLFFANDEQYIYFLFFEDTAHRAETQDFFQLVDNVFHKTLRFYEQNKDENFTMLLKENLTDQFNIKYKEQTFRQKVNNLKDKSQIAQEKSQIILQKVNKNSIGLDQVNTEINNVQVLVEQNDETQKNIKQEQNNTGLIVLIGVIFCLLAVIIFVNLFTAVKNPKGNAIGSSFYESRLEQIQKPFEQSEDKWLRQKYQNEMNTIGGKKAQSFSGNPFITVTQDYRKVLIQNKLYKISFQNCMFSKFQIILFRNPYITK